MGKTLFGFFNYLGSLDYPPCADLVFFYVNFNLLIKTHFFVNFSGY